MGILDRLKKKDDKQGVKAKPASDMQKKESSAKQKEAKKPAAKQEAPKKEGLAKGLIKRDKGKDRKEAAAPTARKATTATPGAVAAATSVLLRPIVTEKATLTGTYFFEVDPKTNKNEVKKAVESVYGVKPESVRIMNIRGKIVRMNYQQGKRKNWKKAVVKLPKGQTINVYEGT